MDKQNRKPYGYGGPVIPADQGNQEVTRELVSLLKTQVVANVEMQRALLSVLKQMKRERAQRQLPERTIDTEVFDVPMPPPVRVGSSSAEGRGLAAVACAVSAGISFTLAVAFFPGPGFIATPTFGLLGAGFLCAALYYAYA